MMFTILGLGRCQIGLPCLLLAIWSQQNPNSNSMFHNLSIKRPSFWEVQQQSYMENTHGLTISESITLARKIK